MEDGMKMTRVTLGKWMDRGANLVILLFGMAVLWIVLQVLVFTSFRIPSDSMEPVLVDGDAILVDKMKYGARIFDVRKAMDGEQVDIHRLPGWGKVERNDVVVFNYPCPRKWKRMEMDIMVYYVKRCVALPGDTFRIVDGRYCVDGWKGSLGNVEAQDRFMRMIEERGMKEDDTGVRAYPGDASTGWTVKEFGPLYIPRAGDSIALDARSVKLYRNVIEWEQGKSLRYRDGEAWLGEKAVKGYRFKKNYYFMAGDKADNSKDSRYWGLLPGEYIVGKAWKIWKSVDRYSDRMRWDRVWKDVE